MENSRQVSCLIRMQLHSRHIFRLENSVVCALSHRPYWFVIPVYTAKEKKVQLFKRDLEQI